MFFFNIKKKKIDFNIKAIITLKIKAQSATSGQPVGPLLGQYGIPIMPFCNEFNKRTSNFHDDVELFAVIDLFMDGSYTFKIKMPSLSFLLKRASLYKKKESLDSNSFFFSVDDEQERTFLPCITTYQLYEVVIYKLKKDNLLLNKKSLKIKTFFFRSLGTLKSTKIIRLS